MLPVDADPLARRHWTVDDLDDLPDDGLRYECLDGQLVVVTPPQTLHQVVAMRLLRQLDPQIPPGWQLLYDQGVRLGTDWRIPDFVVLPSDAPLDGRVHDPETVGLAVEIVSPTSRRTDRIVKSAEYADAGVPFYWRVETEPRVLVAAHSLDRRRYGEPVVLDAGSGRLPAPFPVRLDVDALDPR